MLKYSDDQIRIAEETASAVYDKQVTMSEGARLLAEKHGFNLNSAKDFIANYRCMLQGRVFQRSLGASTVRHYLDAIAQKRGPEALAFATSSVDLHIAYYESVVGGNMLALRGVVDQKRQAAPPLSFAAHASSFDEAVRESLDLPSSKRQARLTKAPKKPAKVAVSTFVFARNPDVVAEVLLRAAGSCESCEKPAPFLRKKDGTPYLEVHHRQPLAEEGEDTVENALALCPNCHRRLHHGLPAA